MSVSLFQPAEWAPHRACWLAWPSAGDLWEENLAPAQKEFTALAKAIGESEKLEILVPSAAARADAERALEGLGARFHDVPFGDIWVRDTGPIFMKDAAGSLHASRFAFNGWGGKYILDHDDRVSARVSEITGLPVKNQGWVLEGGAMETDGEGTLLTTEQCLLNANRHPDGRIPPKAELEKRLCEAFGARKVLWIREGLLNDHTDGHVDTIARFVKPGVAVCMQAMDKDDPNAAVMDEMARLLASSTDAQGRRLQVERVPSPGKVLDDEGEIMPASYMNFYLSNGHVIVPTYGTKWDGPAVEAIAKLFPGRKTVGLSAYAILSGGGAFHCITQQEPS
jgi:agmatine deiminase